MMSGRSGRTVGQDDRVLPTSSPTGRVDGSMSLLLDAMTGSLDPSYAAAATRQGAPRRATRTVVLGLVLLLLGVVTGTAVAQVRARSGATTDARHRLAAEVRRQTGASDRLVRQVGTLREQVARQRDQALGAGALGRAAATELATVELLSGATPARGPGVVVTLDDARSADATAGAATGDTTTAPRGGQTGDGRVLDRDLQDVANALWSVGTEAMSINGLRLTAQTAIRSAGAAILVDFRPLSPPYVLRAIGDPARLEPDFVDSPTGRRFATYTSLYGLGFEVSRSHDLRLAAAGAPDLRLVRPVVAP